MGMDDVKAAASAKCPSHHGRQYMKALSLEFPVQCGGSSTPGDSLCSAVVPAH